MRHAFFQVHRGWLSLLSLIVAMGPSIAHGQASLGSNPDRLTAVGDTVFFTADDGVHGVELWKTDGTAAGTALVRDIFPGDGGFPPSALTAIGDKLYFSANDGLNGPEPWISDGTAPGTRMIRDVEAGPIGSNPLEYAEAGGQVFFPAFVSNTPTKYLWKTDGTSQGTVLVKNVNVLTEDHDNRLQRMAAMNGKLYFIGLGKTLPEALFQSDGTSAGTAMIKDLFEPRQLTACHGYVYFTAGDGYLSRSDGTPEGTGQFSGQGWVSVLRNVQNQLFWLGTDGLWRSDGTSASTYNLTGPFSFEGRQFAILNGVPYYLGTSGLNYGLWKGVARSSMPVKLFSGNTYGSNTLIESGGKIFILVWLDTGYQLWWCDNTMNGVVMARPFPNSIHINSCGLTAAGGKVYFHLDDGTHGDEMWVSDGTAAGTRMVLDIRGYNGVRDWTRY